MVSEKEKKAGWIFIKVAFCGLGLLIVFIMCVAAYCRLINPNDCENCNTKQCRQPKECLRADISVFAETTKPSGANWDIDGSLPDIHFSVDGKWVGGCIDLSPCTARNVTVSGTTAELVGADKEFGKKITKRLRLENRSEPLCKGTFDLFGTTHLGGCWVKSNCTQAR